MPSPKEIATTWNGVTKTVTGTVAAAAAIIAVVAWFQPSGTANIQHKELADDFHLEMSQHQSDQNILALEAELQRIETTLKLYAAIRERRALTPDEQDEYEYLKARRLQIRERLFDK